MKIFLYRKISGVGNNQLLIVQAKDRAEANQKLNKQYGMNEMDDITFHAESSAEISTFPIGPFKYGL